MMKKIFLSITAVFSVYTMEAQQFSQSQPLHLSLRQCREMALENSEDIKIADFQTEKANVEKRIAQTAYLPKLSATGTYAYMYGDMELGLPAMDLKIPIMGMEIDVTGLIPEKMDMNINTDMFMAGASIQQPIYAGGKIITGNKMADKGRELTKEYAHMTRMGIVVEAEKAYWTYYSVIDKIKLLEQYEILLDTLYQSISAMISVQMATENELLKITSRQGNIRYQMQKAKNGMELSRMMLCRTIGVDLATEIILTENISTDNTPTGLIPPSINSLTAMSQDVTARPEYRMLQLQLDIKDLNMKMVRGDYLPTVGLMAGYFYMGEVKMDDIAMRMKRPMPAVLVSLSVPIFHFGEGAKKVQSARIARDIQQEELTKTGNLLTIEMQHATRNLQDAFLLISISEKALEEAQANLRRTRDNYELGLGTLLDVLDAQVQWQEASSHTIDARVQYKISEVEYLKVSGKLDD